MKRHGELDDRAIVSALLDAYRQGAFPMADARTGRVEFFTADPRGILPLHEQPDAHARAFHVPQRLERTIRSGRFTLRADTDFHAVITACMLTRPRAERWIDPTLVAWYHALHRAGHAHSIEAWRTDPQTGRDHLVGGIYGVSIGAAFFGESMFIRPQSPLPGGSRHPLDGTDASKVCLVTLVRHLRTLGYCLFDTQMVTEHVARFGGHDIPGREYLKLLEQAVQGPDRWRPLEPRLPSSPRADQG